MKLPKSLMKVLFPKKKKSSSSSKSAPPPPSSPSRSNVSKNAARGYNQVLDNESSSSPSSSPRASPPGTPARATTSTPTSLRRGKKQKQAVAQQAPPQQEEEYFPKEQQHNDFLQLCVVDSNDKNSPVTVATTLTCASRASSSPEDFLIRRNSSSSSSSSNDDDLDEKRGVEFEGDNDNDVGDTSSADISPIAKSILTFENEAAVDGPSFPTLQGSNIIESGDDNDNDDSLQENHQSSEEDDVQEDVVVMMTPAKTSAFNVIGGVDDPVEGSTKPQDAVAVSVDATEDDTAALANAADIPASTNTTDKAEEPPNSPTTSTTSPSTTSASSPQQQTTSTSTKKVQFSLRGEEARQRAIARQKKILSKASLRLDAISDTSLENIEEAVANSSNAANKKEEDSPSGKEDEESISTGMGNDDGLVVGDISSVAAVTSAEEDGKSIKSIVSHQVLGEGNGAMSSILFYESSPTNRMIKKKDEEDAEGEDVAEQEIRQVSSGENNEEEQGGDFEQKKETSPLQELMSDNSLSPDSKETSPTTTKPKEKNMHFFILLLCPTSRIFELVEISNAKPHSTIQDILNVIPLQCTDERLLSMKYMGFVRPSDRMEFSDLDKRAFEIVEEQRDFWEKKEQQQQQQQQNGDGNNKEDDGWGDEREDWPTSLNTIREDDVLVAILDGYSGYQMSKISKPILRNAKFRDMIRRRSRRSKKKRGHHHGSSSSSHHFDKDDSRSLKSNKSRSSRNSSSRRRKSGGGSSSKKGRNGSVSSSSRSKRHHPKRSSGTPPMFEIDTETNKTPKNTKASNDKSSSSSSKDHPEKGASSTNNERYSTLCQRLEHLSKKLHDVDDEIMAGGVDDDDLSLTSGKLPTIAGSPSRPEKSASTDTIDDCENIDGTEVKNNGIPEEVQGIPEVNFKMTSKMVAYELAANIEDIFADHNVEIVAVDADPDDSDDDTFVSARSMRSLRSVRSVRSLVQGFDVGHGLNDRKGEDGDDDNKNQQQQPLFEITTKSKRRKRKPRQKFDMFESGEEDDMMLQIEAMAKQADAAFESRKKSVVPGTAIIEPKIEPIENKTNGQKYLGKEEESEDDTQELETGKSEAMAGDGGNDVEEEEVIQTMASVDEEIDLTPDDVLGAIGKSIGSKGSTVNESAISTAKPAAAQSSSQSDALSRNFLNASTSMVSTMVAASQGRINEVHVLQYLGVTIVCIAANFLQKTGAASKNNTSPGGVAKEVFQSAMFLAFMVNGQRYLAKVTKKGGSA